MAFLGLRRAEVFALMWSDVNFDKKTILVNKAVTLDSKKKLILDTTKTGDTRELYVDDVTLDILKEWQTTQKLILGKLKKDQLIFPNALNEISFPSKAFDWCNSIVEKYQLKPVNPHGLRRTHATMYHAAGAGYYEIKKRLGHSFKDVTAKSHIMDTEETKYEAFQKFINYMNY